METGSRERSGKVRKATKKDQEVAHIGGVKHGATGSSQQGYSRQRAGVNAPGEIFGLWSGRRKMRQRMDKSLSWEVPPRPKTKEFFVRSRQKIFGLWSNPERGVRPEMSRTGSLKKGLSASRSAQGYKARLSGPTHDQAPLGPCPPQWVRTLAASPLACGRFSARYGHVEHNIIPFQTYLYCTTTAQNHSTRRLMVHLPR